MGTVTEYRSISAKYYDDAYAVKQDLVNLDFYLELAKQSGGPVLEIGCGTGRVLLPIAREGIEIHGVDNSSPMLQVLQEHLQAEPQQVRANVKVHPGDMRDFRLNRKYPLVIIPFRPLQHMCTLGDQLNAFTTAAFHLDQGGTLAFDVFYPKFNSISAGIGQETLELEWSSPSDPARVVRRYYRKDSVDKISQILSLTFIFRTYQGSELVLEESEPLTMSYYTYPHLQALFRLAGLEAAAEYGSFDRTPLDNSSEEMIFLLRKRSEAGRDSHSKLELTAFGPQQT